jgi:1-acyl-sn-glycerol-3-phosphate acyltransferase
MSRVCSVPLVSQVVKRAEERILRLCQGPAIIRHRLMDSFHLYPDNHTLVDSTVHVSENRCSTPPASWGTHPWLHIAYSAVGLFFRLWCRMRIEGAEHIPCHGGVLLASNHISLLDPVLISYSVMAKRGVQIVWAPAKVELFRMPLFGHLVASLGAFPVRRGRSDLHAIRRMAAHMRTEKLMLFPEGTRSRDGRLGAGKRTVGKLLHEGQPIVVPAAVWGTDRVLFPGSWWPRFRPQVGVRYGAPLDLQRYYALPGTKETAAAIVQELMRSIATLLETEKPPVTVASTGTHVEGLYNETPRA